MFITGSTLKLYTNNTFKEETASDMIKPDGSSELMISRGEIQKNNKWNYSKL